MVVKFEVKMGQALWTFYDLALISETRTDMANIFIRVTDLH